MKMFILLAVVGLCRAGGVPLAANYAIATHGPDRSFTMVQKSAVPMAFAAPPMTMARGFLANNAWGWAGRSMLAAPAIAGPAIAGPAIAATPFAYGAHAMAAPLVSKTDVITTKTFAAPVAHVAAAPMIARADLAAPAIMAGRTFTHGPVPLIANSFLGHAAIPAPLAMAAPTVATSYVSRAVHDPVAIAKPVIAAAPVAFANKNFLEQNFMNNKLAARAFLDDAIMKESHLKEKMIEGMNAPIAVATPTVVGTRTFAAPVAHIAAAPMMAKANFATHAFAAPTVVASRTFAAPMIARADFAAPVAMAAPAYVAGRTFAVESPGMIARADFAAPAAFMAGRTFTHAAAPLIANNFLGHTSIATPLAAAPIAMAAPAYVAGRTFAVESPGMMARVMNDKMMADKYMYGAPLAIADKWMGKTYMAAPMALNAAIAPMAVATPFGIKGYLKK